MCSSAASCSADISVALERSYPPGALKRREPSFYFSVAAMVYPPGGPAGRALTGWAASQHSFLSSLMWLIKSTLRGIVVQSSTSHPPGDIALANFVLSLARGFHSLRSFSHLVSISCVDTDYSRLSSFRMFVPHILQLMIVVRNRIFCRILGRTSLVFSEY